MDRNCRIWNKCKLLPIGGDARVLERLSYCVELIVGSGNNILLLLSCQLLCTGLQGDFKKPVFADGTPGNGDPPLFVEHVGIAAAGLGRNRNLAGQLAEERPALRIESALKTLNLGPLAVSGHAMGILVKLPDRPVFFCEPESLERIVIEEANLPGKLNCFGW